MADEKRITRLHLCINPEAELGLNHAWMEPYDDGQYVKYSDHLDALGEAEAVNERLRWQLLECHRLALGAQRPDPGIDVFHAPAEEVRDLRIALEEGERRWVSETVVAAESERDDVARELARVSERLEDAREKLMTLRSVTLARVCQERDQANTRAEAAEEEVRGLRERLKKDADFWLGLAASEVEPGEREGDVDFGYSKALRSCADSVLAALKSAGEGEAS